METDKHAATLTKGSPGVLHGSMSYLLQDGEGQIIDPHSISAGYGYCLHMCISICTHVSRLDYPGIGPEHAWLKDSGRAEYYAVTDAEALESFQRVSQLEGIIPALETSHAFAYLEVRGGVVVARVRRSFSYTTEAVPDAGRRHDGGDQL